jgi:hypothetical protein
MEANTFVLRPVLAPATDKINQIPQHEFIAQFSPKHTSDLKRLSAAACSPADGEKTYLKKNSSTPDKSTMASPYLRKAQAEITRSCCEMSQISGSSPVGSDLLMLKTRRSADAFQRQFDAPAGSVESSPIGHGLMERKLAAAALRKLDVANGDKLELEFAAYAHEFADDFVKGVIADVFAELFHTSSLKDDAAPPQTCEAKEEDAAAVELEEGGWCSNAVSHGIVPFEKANPHSLLKYPVLQFENPLDTELARKIREFMPMAPENSRQFYNPSVYSPSMGTSQEGHTQAQELRRAALAAGGECHALGGGGAAAEDTKAPQALMMLDEALEAARCSVYLLYWYKSTNTDAARAPREAPQVLDETLEAASPPSERDPTPPTPNSVVDDVRYARWLWRQVLAQFTRFTGTKVQILTHRARQKIYSRSLLALLVHKYNY